MLLVDERTVFVPPRRDEIAQDGDDVVDGGIEGVLLGAALFAAKAVVGRALGFGEPLLVRLLLRDVRRGDVVAQTARLRPEPFGRIDGVARVPQRREHTLDDSCAQLARRRVRREGHGAVETPARARVAGSVTFVDSRRFEDRGDGGGRGAREDNLSAPRSHRLEERFRVGGEEHDRRRRRWFLQRFEKGVLRVRIHAVRPLDDDHAPCAVRGAPRRLHHVTNLLDDSGRYINQILRSALDATNSAAALWAAGVAAGKLPLRALAESDLIARGVATGRGAANRVLFQADPDYRNNYSIQGSLGIERQIAQDLGLEVSYQMYRGAHIQKQHQINYRESETPNSRGPAFGPAYVRIDPTIAQLNNYESTGNSIYHGMTASLKRRYGRHMQFQVNYTFSKAIDDVTDYNSAFAAAFPTRLYLERARSSFDLRHNFVASGVFQSPFRAGAERNPLARALADVTLSPIVFLRSGIPFTLTTGADTNGDTHPFNDRLIYIGRNTGNGPRFASADVRVNKAFFIRRDSGVRVEFLMEATNLFNHANFAAVNDVLGVDPNSVDYNRGTFRLKGDKSRSLTQPLGFTAAFDPRRVQFGLKVGF